VNDCGSVMAPKIIAKRTVHNRLQSIAVDSKRHATLRMKLRYFCSRISQDYFYKMSLIG
jgi:hypothetical protein